MCRHYVQQMKIFFPFVADACMECRFVDLSSCERDVACRVVTAVVWTQLSTEVVCTLPFVSEEHCRMIIRTEYSDYVKSEIWRLSGFLAASADVLAPSFCARRSW